MKITEDTQAKVRERAYLLWESAGRPEGRSDEFWMLAMQEVFASPSMVTPDKPKKAAAKKPAAKKTVAKAAATPTKKEPAKKAPAKKIPAK